MSLTDNELLGLVVKGVLGDLEVELQERRDMMISLHVVFSSMRGSRVAFP